MYSRNLAGQDVEFGVSGKLWHGVLVMFDRHSDSLWTQLDGRAIQGMRRGTKLEYFPSTFTTWSRWRKAHPETLVLEKDDDSKGQQQSRYADYFDDPDRLYFPHLVEGLGDAIAPKTTVFGVSLDGDAIAVPEALLEQAGTLSVRVAEHNITLVRDTTTGAVTGTSDAAGKASGVRVDRAFWYAWKRSHPESRTRVK